MVDFYDFMNAVDSIATMCNFVGGKDYVNNAEINALAEGLRSRSMQYTRTLVFDGEQIRCDDWDVVIHCGSYGHEKGLLEIMYPTGEIEGNLTAEAILAWFDATHNWTAMEDN